MNITYSGNVSDDLRKAVAEHDADTEGPHVALYERVAPVDGKQVTSALADGETLAIAHAPAGPVFGGHIPALTRLTEPAALVAVSRRRVGHGYMTSITVLPESRTTSCVIVTDQDGQCYRPEQPAAPEPTFADIAAALAGHFRTSAQAAADSSLIPPPGAKFGIVQLNVSWPQTFTQDFWHENKGASQKMTSNNSQYYYVYYANGKGAPTPYYVVLAIQSGTVQPATGGPLCDYSPNERVFVLASNLLSVDLSKAPAESALIAYSPDGTRGTPVYDSVEIPMTVMAISDGGLQSTAFTAARSASVPNEDWGVRKTSLPDRGRYEAAVQYYNVTGWDASSQESWANWWPQMYDGDDYVIDLDAQCRTSASFDTMAAWTVPQNAGNQAPLSFQIRYTNIVDMAGFANKNGVGEPLKYVHEMVSPSSTKDQYLPVWDLVALTGAS